MEERKFDSLKGWRRSHYGGDLRPQDVENQVTLFGWVHRRRDHGGLIFIDLRDRTGLVQLVFNPERSRESHNRAQELRNEYVIAVRGTVAKRPEGTANPNLATGEVEVLVEELGILNDCQPLPFQVEEGEQAAESLRLKYRYLDLRRPAMQENLRLRHQVVQVVRNYLTRVGFLEIETPFLTKSTPEGARDYLVPSRTSPGCFFALPQSPQLFKQVLMVAGYDRYFQVVRCFRDEDLRADRQPEFTQIDLEMSFVQKEDVFDVVEGLLAEVFLNTKGIGMERPFRRLSYDEALARFGLDSPDLRFGLELVDLTSGAAQGSFPPFGKALSEGGIVKGINPGALRLSRRQLDELAEEARFYGAQGFTWIRLAQGKWTGGAAHYFPLEGQQKINKAAELKEGDLLILAAGQPARVCEALGRLRLKLAKEFNLIPEDSWEFLWVTDFPLLEFSKEEGRLVSKHHPFTSPKEEDVPKLRHRPEEVRAQAYDVILNGTELGGGSIRIHRAEIQSLMLEILGYKKEEAQEKFGFLLEALEYGAPPHGGIALGLDRLVMILARADSLREVLAFPKTSKGVCLMTSAPDRVAPEQLEELRLKVVMDE